MASNFPGTSIDSFATVTDGVTTVLAAHQNDRAAAIVAAQTKIGVDADTLSATTLEGRAKFQETGGLKRGSSVASATSITLPAGAQVFPITGTTTIATITSPGYARLVYLEFASALTLDHGAGNLTMPGATDLAVAAGTVLALEWTGSTWQVVGAASGTTFATPAVVLGSSAAAGAATTVMRSDATIAAFDATAPSTQAIGDSAVVGTAAFAARRDHKHAMPAFATTSDIADVAATEAAGSAATIARGDHVHALGSHNHTSGAGDGGVLTNDAHDGYSDYAEIAAPGTPAASTVRVYAKADGLLYSKDDAGVETLVSGGAGGGLSYAGTGDIADTAATESAGVATTVPRGDHVHALGGHNHTSGAGDGGVLTNDAHDGYLDVAEIAAPSGPAANTLRLYAKDTAGLTELYYKNSAGTERDLGAASAGSLAAHDHTSAGGDGGVLSNDEHDGYSEYTEIATPSNPAANKLRVYPKDVSGITKLATLDSAGTETVMGSGGGGGLGQLSPMTAPQTASPFTNWINQGSASATDEADGLYLLGPAEGTRNFRGRVEAVPGGSWTRTVGFLPMIAAAGGEMVGLFITDGLLTSSKVVSMEWIVSGNIAKIAVEYWSTVSGGTASTQYVGPVTSWGPLVWFQVSDNATNLTFKIGSDGVHFPITLLSVGRTAHLTPAYVGLYVASNAANTVPAMKALHYA